MIDETALKLAIEVVRNAALTKEAHHAWDHADKLKAAAAALEGLQAALHPSLDGIGYVDSAMRGLVHLQEALAWFDRAKSRQTLQRVRHAISSARGAVRAAQYRECRQAESERN